MRIIFIIIGGLLEIALAYAKGGLYLSSQISLFLLFLFGISTASQAILIKPRQVIKIVGSKNVKINSNMVEECDFIIKGSQNVTIASSPISTSKQPNFKSFLYFLGILIMMILTYMAANWGFGQLKQ